MSTKTLVEKISQPYAEAIIEIAKQEDSLDSTTQEIKLILETLTEEKELKTFLANPMVPASAKKDLLAKIFTSDTSTFLKNFIMILVNRGRVFMLDSIAEKYLELAYEASNTIIAKVVSSTSLTDQQKDSLREKIKSMVNASNVELLLETDNSLIAGLTVQIGSQLIDTSLKGQLKQMATHLDIVF